MKIYTDGATSLNGQENAFGGWAYIVINDNNEIVSMGNGAVKPATNNICELLAVVNACDSVKGVDSSFTIYSDSSYIVNCWTDRWYENWERNGWLNSKKEPVANRGLWERLIPYFRDSRFFFKKVKGHNGDLYNEMVDKLAVEAKIGGENNS